MKNWYKLLNKQDFGMVVDENGYQLTFKGYRIGGAGTEPQQNVSDENKILRKKNFEEMANHSIDKILAGSGDKRFYKSIKDILGV